MAPIWNMLWRQGSPISFIETVTAAISHFHLAHFRISPTCHPASKWALAAARKLLATPVKRAKPFTPELLRDVHAVALAHHLAHILAHVHVLSWSTAVE